MQKVYILAKNEEDIKYPINKEIILVRYPPKLSKNYKVIENLFIDGLELTDNDIFVSYQHPSPVDFRLDKYTIPTGALAITTNNLDLEEVLNEDNEEYNYLEDYALFSGKKLNVSKRETKSAIVKSMKLLSEVLYEMLHAGYLELKNEKKISDWIVSFEEPTLKLFKIYHQIETSNPSIDFEEEFLINPQFREMNMLIIMKILANFMINNNMITLEQVSKIGSWEESHVWIKMRKKVKLLNY
jgi:hypothetical protein